MKRPHWPRALRALLPLAALTGLLSCQTTTVVEEDPPATTGGNIVKFGVPDSVALPDSLWYRTRLDSGTTSFTVERTPKSLGIVLLPTLQPLGERDTVTLHTYRFGLHLGATAAVFNSYRDWVGVRTVRTAADSFALGLFRAFDSLRKANPAAFKDTTAAGKREAFRQVVAQLVFAGHPSTAKYSKIVVAGLDTAKINRQVLTLAATSGLTLGEVVRRWNLGLDYATTRSLLAPLGLDTASLQPFRLEAPLHLDTLHLGEPAVGLTGKLFGQRGIKALDLVVVNDSGIRTDRFVQSDAPDLKSHPARVDLAGHPTLEPRPGTPTGSYTLKLQVSDSLGNVQTYSAIFVVAPALDHAGPDLKVLAPTGPVVRDHNDPLLQVKVEAKDASGVKSVRVGDAEAKRDGYGNWILEIEVPVDSVGHEVKIEAWDSVGNSTSKQILIRRNTKPIPTAPRLSLVAPSNGTWLAFEDSLVKVSWKAQTDFGVIDSVTIDGVQARKDGDAWVRELKLPANGKLANVVARAYSSVPLVATEYVSVGRKADSAGPVVKWISPSQGHRVAYDVKTLEIMVSALDLSGLDSVRIQGKKPDTVAGVWKVQASLNNPGELTRILVQAWDRAGNRSDSTLLVSRDPIPGQLPPAFTWILPGKPTGTVIPFAETRYLVRCVLTDISGMDSSSVKIAGEPASRVNDSVWERWVDLPPTGQAQVITLEAKNNRGVSVSAFVSVARSTDSEKPTSERGSLTKNTSVPWDTTSVVVAWTAKDNDRIARAWIQDSLVVADATGYHLRVPLAIATQWIKFRAVDPAGNEVRDSVSIERKPDTVKAVQFSDTNGKLRSGIFWVKLSCATAGATIRYTLDGTDPRSTSPLFVDSIQVDTSLILKARAFAKDRVDAPVAIQTYKMAVPVRITSSPQHALVEMSDGTLWGMGETSGNRFSPEPPCGAGLCVMKPTKIAENVIEAAAGYSISLWIDRDSSLWAIGDGSAGTLGLGSTQSRSTPTLVRKNVKSVRAGWLGRASNSYVIDWNGDLYGAGYCGYMGFQTGCSVDATSSRNLAKLGFSWIMNKAKDVTESNGSVFLSENGSLIKYDRINDSLQMWEFDKDVAFLSQSFGNEDVVYVKNNGEVWGFGYNDFGELGPDSTGKRIGSPHRIEAGTRKWVQSWHVDYSLYLLDQNGDLFEVGAQLGADWSSAKTNAAPVLVLSGVKSFALQQSDLFVIMKDGTLWVKGANGNGELGFGHTNPVTQLTRVKF